MAKTVPHPIVKSKRLYERNVMNDSLPLKLLPEDKLDLLRYLDEFRFWHSLEDERRCTRCKHTITGKQLLVFEANETRGKLRLQCPTPGCPSGPSEWNYANPVRFAASGTFPAGSPETLHPDVHAASANYRQTENARARKAPRRRRASLRATLARLPVLRPLAMGLHAIYPVA